MGFIIGIMEINMKENLKKIKQKEQGKLSLIMVLNMKENLKIIFVKDMG